MLEDAQKDGLCPRKQFTVRASPSLSPAFDIDVEGGSYLGERRGGREGEGNSSERRSLPFVPLGIRARRWGSGGRWVGDAIRGPPSRCSDCTRQLRNGRAGEGLGQGSAVGQGVGPDQVGGEVGSGRAWAKVRR